MGILEAWFFLVSMIGWWALNQAPFEEDRGAMAWVAEGRELMERMRVRMRKWGRRGWRGFWRERWPREMGAKIQGCALHCFLSSLPLSSMSK